MTSGFRERMGETGGPAMLPDILPELLYDPDHRVK